MPSYHGTIAIWGQMSVLWKVLLHPASLDNSYIYNSLQLYQTENALLSLNIQSGVERQMEGRVTNISNWFVIICD